MMKPMRSRMPISRVKGTELIEESAKSECPHIFKVSLWFHQPSLGPSIMENTISPTDRAERINPRTSCLRGEDDAVPAPVAVLAPVSLVLGTVRKAPMRMRMPNGMLMKKIQRQLV